MAFQGPEIVQVTKNIIVDQNLAYPVSMNAMNIALSPLPFVGMRTCKKYVLHINSKIFRCYEIRGLRSRLP